PRELNVTPPQVQRAASRREALMARLAEGVAVFVGARQKLRSADSEYSFRQDSDFYYLTGFDEPDAVCVLRATPPRYVLFVRPRDRDAETWNGPRAGVEGACGIYGADAAYPIAELRERLGELLRDADTLHYALARDAALDALVLEILGEHRRLRPRRGRGIVRIEDPSLSVHEMRVVKDGYEIDRMRHAAEITC